MQDASNALSILFSGYPSKLYQPTIWLIDAKRIPTGLFKLIISDGISSQKAEYIGNDHIFRLEDFFEQIYLITLDEFFIDKVKKKDKLFILKFTIIKALNKNNFENDKLCRTEKNQNLNRNESNIKITNGFLTEGSEYTPINELTLNSKGWKIKARVIKKYNLHEWHKENRHGYALKYIIKDSNNAEAMITSFNKSFIVRSSINLLSGFAKIL